jgi:hypothetical protein
MICGKKCTGKSTAAQYIAKGCERYGLKPFIVSLGAGVKRVFLELGKLFQLRIKEKGADGVVRNVEVGMRHLEDRDVKEQLRHYLQAIGSDVMRNMVFQDIWSLSLHEEMKRICDGLGEVDKPVIIIDDIRYQNELNYFQQRYCYTIGMVLRKGVDGVGKGASKDVVDSTNNDTKISSSIEFSPSTEDLHESEQQEITGNFVYYVDKPLDIYRNDMMEFVDRFVPNMKYQKYYWCNMVDWKSRDRKDDDKLSEQPETWVVRK